MIRCMRCIIRLIKITAYFSYLSLILSYLGINDRAFDSCGDGEMQAEEECDDEISIVKTGVELCLIAQCGDGFIHRDNETF